MSKRALGKGLDALIGPEEPGSRTDEHSLQTIAIDLIDAAADQPRKHFDDERLHELAESIRNEGIIQPIVVEPNGDRFTIVAGERRYRAAKLVGLTEVPVNLSQHGKDKRFLLSLIENLQRENLDPIEEAEAFRTLIDQTGASQDVVAKQVGKSRVAVANSLRLLNLSEEIKQALIDGKISAGHARALLSIIDTEERMRIFRRIIAEGLSVREVEELSRLAAGNDGLIQSKKKPVPERKPAPEIQGIEQQFIEALGTKVKLKGTLTKGTVEISYFSKEDLQRLYDLFVPE